MYQTIEEAISLRILHFGVTNGGAKAETGYCCNFVKRENL